MNPRTKKRSTHEKTTSTEAPKLAVVASPASRKKPLSPWEDSIADRFNKLVSYVWLCDLALTGIEETHDDAQPVHMMFHELVDELKNLAEDVHETLHDPKPKAGAS